MGSDLQKLNLGPGYTQFYLLKNPKSFSGLNGVSLNNYEPFGRQYRLRDFLKPFDMIRYAELCLTLPGGRSLASGDLIHLYEPPYRVFMVLLNSRTHHHWIQDSLVVGWHENSSWVIQTVPGLGVSPG